MARPSIRERAAAKLCPNCGQPSPPRKSPRGPAPRYCDNDGRCKREKNNRDLRDGLSLVNFVKAWRIDRGTGEIAKASFQRMCDIGDMLNEEDRAADRPRADYVAAVLVANEYHSVKDLRYGRRKVAEARARAASEAVDQDADAPAIDAPAAESTESTPNLADILKMIADGHNDARALAEQALAAIGK